MNPTDTEVPADPEHLKAGSTLGRYVILSIEGVGGMGAVYSAYDPQLDRKVAIKVLRTGDARDATEGRSRLLREAKAMARLAHPNVVAVHDSGVAGDVVFIAMEFVQGTTLRGWLREKNRTYSEILDVFTHAGRGLAAAHAAGIIHRDFKPDNVLIGEGGRVCVADFGLARAVSGPPEPSEPAQPGDALDETATVNASGGRLTRTGAIMGTPAYMAPEQVLGGSADARADQFGFCVALFEALYGKRPFAGESISDVVMEAAKGRIAETDAGREVPSRIRGILVRGLSAEPGHRHTSMDSLLAELNKRPVFTARRAWAALVVVVLAVTGVLVHHHIQRQKVLFCAGGEKKLSGIWDSARKQAVEKAFRATGVSYAGQVWEKVEQALDRRVAAWVAMHKESCEATRVRGEQSEEVFDLRVECLTSSLEEIETLTGLLVTANAEIVEKAATFVSTGADIKGCANVEALRSGVGPARDPADRAKVREIRKVHRRAQSLERGGKNKEALSLATEAVAAARRLDYCPIQVETISILADIQWRGGNLKVAEETFYDVLWAADACRDDRTRADMLTRLVFLVGYQLGRRDEALRLARACEAVLERLGSLGEASRADLQTSLGTLEQASGDYEKALLHYERALEMSVRHHGRAHPNSVVMIANVGDALVRLGRFDEAERLLLERLKVLEQTFGENHPQVSDALNSIGVLFFEQDLFEKALPYYERARAIAVGAWGRENPSTAYSTVNLGELFLFQRKYAEALALLQEAVAILEKAYGKNHPWVGIALTRIGLVHLGMGKPASAVALIERALAITERTKDLYELGVTRFALARALWELGRERKRARHLAASAREAFSKAGKRGTRRIAEIDGWLSSHKGQ